MNLDELLDYSAQHDIRLSVESDHLRVDAPRGALSDELKHRLLEHKLELIVAFSGNKAANDCHTKDELRYATEERMAIMEYDGGLTRPQAENGAFWPRLSINTFSVWPGKLAVAIHLTIATVRKEGDFEQRTTASSIEGLLDCL